MFCEIGKIKNVVFHNKNTNIPYYVFVNRNNPQCLEDVNEAMILYSALEPSVKKALLDKIENGTINETYLQYLIPPNAKPTAKKSNISVEVADVTIYEVNTNIDVNTDVDIEDLLINVVREMKEIFINSKELVNIATKPEQEIIYLYLARKLFDEKLKEETSNKIITIVSVICTDLVLNYLKNKT